MMHDGPWGGMGGMMGELMVGSGWLALLACLVLGGFARVPLRAAGERRAEGQPWAVPGAVGFGLLAVAVVVALAAWGTFFGFMGIAFAAVTAPPAVLPIVPRCLPDGAGDVRPRPAGGRLRKEGFLLRGASAPPAR